ncbi:fluoride efflux transporter CrcB [Goodfellowiella coeruleoviolacea]|uniref:Fluoride-specific ion channel FluC n=1 Tax=Goodfellowiella coeruleoviolacea TaxID=334858 RepID=A0AAE3GGB7_9PSEU|nr:fluoride efflux transporter CrcB [Goodfellowiella coeruleoviolacea]MCP2167605.1 CrcB protein [Goodfellowiella coeruleoviolacea]
MDWLLVVVGAMVGAPLRYLTDRLVQSRHDTVFPWGTLVVNLVGSAVLGALAATAAAPEAQLLIGTGFCGALTTYSTFSYETLRLAQDGAWLLGAANVVVSVSAGLGAAGAGAALAHALLG